MIRDELRENAGATAEAAERARIDRKIGELVAAAPKMTPAHSARIRRQFRYGPPEAGKAR
jgi:hypothetical protein